MTKLPTVLLAATMVGALAANALVPMAYAQDASTSTSAPAQSADQPASAQNGQPPMLQNAKGSMAPGARGMMGPRAGGGFLLGLMCSDQAASRLEQVLDRMATRLALSDEQKPLFDDLKTAALSGATAYADACTTLPRDGTATIVDAFKARETNMQAQLDAMKDVTPALEKFYDSLTDDQKAKLQPMKGRMQRGDRDWRDHDRGTWRDHDRRGDRQ